MAGIFFEEIVTCSSTLLAKPEQIRDLKWLESLAEPFFDNLQANARYDYGHNGYTGTIAEKEGYYVLEPMTMVEIRAQDSDFFKNEKWGPAGCIPILNDEGGLAGFYFYGMASC